MLLAKCQTPPQNAPSFNATSKSLIENAKKLREITKSVADNIVADVKPEAATFANVILPLARQRDVSRLHQSLIHFHQEVSTDDDLRKASKEASKMISDFYNDLYMREDIYKLVDEAFQKHEKLDPESERLLEEERKAYISNGLGLPTGPVRNHFKNVEKELDKNTTDFQTNLNEENGGIWFTKEELEGVPNDVVEGLEKGAGENEGKVKLSFKGPDLVPALKYALSEEVRKKVFIENENKCNANVPLFRKIVLLRDEVARMLGYPNHASLRVKDRLAKTPKTIRDFLGDLRTQLVGRGAQETEYLKGLKKEHLKSRGLEASYDGNYYLWDHDFYNRLMVENEYSINEQEVAEYFPLQSAVKGMLQIFEELFGLVFVEVTGEERDNISETGKGNDIVWHEDVKLFSVWNDKGEGGNFSGYLYLDLHPRPGKYGGGHAYPLQRGFLYPDGTRHYPATALICNFTKPTSTKPSLLKHNELVVLFHELGHGIHDLVSQTTYSRFHGTTVVWDFVEVPSQMLENWCWTPSVLKSLSNHYDTREKIPDDLIYRLIKAEYVNVALSKLQQLHIAIFDMDIYTPETHEHAKSIEIPESFNRSRKEILGHDGPEMLGMSNFWGNGHATFKHLINGYDSGYYSYLYSEPIADDIFDTLFEKHPMNPREGRRYRHTLLEKGGSLDEMDMLVDLLGRKPSSEAFYRKLGLK